MKMHSGIITEKNTFRHTHNIHIFTHTSLQNFVDKHNTMLTKYDEFKDNFIKIAV